MSEQFSRTEIMLGIEAIAKLQQCRVAVFGLGGVGGYVAEALARAGVGALDLIDNDEIAESNLNRQILALHSTIGMKKTAVAQARLKDINPALKIVCHECFYLPETAEQFDFTQYDYIADAIDTVAGKINLAVQAKAAETPIICAMGAGNKLETTAFKVADIAQTKVCPLARVMRKELRLRGIEHLKVVYSEESAQKLSLGQNETKQKIIGSVSFVPAVAGLIMAGEIIKDLVKQSLQVG